jgi:hypothetical protein
MVHLAFRLRHCVIRRENNNDAAVGCGHGVADLRLWLSGISRSPHRCGAQAGNHIGECVGPTARTPRKVNDASSRGSAFIAYDACIAPSVSAPTKTAMTSVMPVTLTLGHTEHIAANTASLAVKRVGRQLRERSRSVYSNSHLTAVQQFRCFEIRMSGYPVTNEEPVGSEAPRRIRLPGVGASRTGRSTGPGPGRLDPCHPDRRCLAAARDQVAPSDFSREMSESL